ncbi:MAG: PorP/SprF family type IX secretion system membrane protein [Bacteroidota bacterium]
MKSFLILLFCISLNAAHAQDFHFSGNEQLPMYLNPAMTGFTKDTPGRAMVKYRNQWSSILGRDAFQTYAASVEGRICQQNFWGFGGFVMRDKSGQPSFQTTQGLISVSYHQKVGSKQYLAGGVNFGRIQYEIDNRLAFGEQFDGNVGFDFNLPSFETIDQLEANLIDIGLGLLLYSAKGQRQQKDKYNWFLGVALQHLNTATNYQFKQNNSTDALNLRLRKTLHGGIALNTTQSRQIAFKANLQWQEPHWQSVFGFYFQLSAVNFGLAARLARNQPNSVFPPVMDAGILSFSYTHNEQLKIGLSYDLNVSPLYRSTNYRGAMEFTASYFFGDSSNCIKDYYKKS